MRYAPGRLHKSRCNAPTIRMLDWQMSAIHYKQEAKVMGIIEESGKRTRGVAVGSGSPGG